MEGLGVLEKATLQEKLEKISGATVTYDNNIEKFTVLRGNDAFKVDLNGNVTVKEPSFSDYSWEEINALAKAISNDGTINGATPQVSKVINGTTYTAKVGDTTTITDLVNTGTTYTVRILGFNYDDLATNNQYDGTATSTGKAGISFEFVSFLKVQDSTDTTNNPIPYTIKAKMNSTNTNSGGWMSSAMKTTLANTVNNLSNKSYIKEVKKPSIGGSSGNWSLNETNTDKLWLLSEFEVFGTQTYATAAKESNYTNAAYAYYANSGSKVKNSSAWWLRSPSCSDGDQFCNVYSDGDFDSYNATRTIGVAPGFSI